MRIWKLLLIAGAVALVLAPRAARADGEVIVSGAYYKERSTRVVQPMVDARLDVGKGQLASHVLLDSITSASPASGAAGVAFDERRWEVGSTYLRPFGIFSIGTGFRFSYEPDYRSIFASVRAAVELAQRNTTIAISLAQGFDEITNAGARGGLVPPIEDQMHTTLTSVQLAQLLSPTLVASLTYDFILVDGFQENVYRQVAAGGVLEAERVPDRRYRNAAFASLRWFIPATKTALIGGYRLYLDNWGVRGHTPEARVVQELVPDFTIEGRYRFHGQTRANFYRDIYDSPDPEVQPFITADPKLSALRTHTASAKITLGLRHLGLSGTLGRSRAIARFEYFAQNTQFGNAVVGQAALAVPFDY